MRIRKIDAMYKEYGKCEQNRCGQCCNLSSYIQSRTWYKCEAYGNSNSEATDWAKKNIACGLFGKLFNAKKQIPLIEKLKHEPKPIEQEPIEGQIVLGGVE